MIVIDEEASSHFAALLADYIAKSGKNVEA